MFHKIFKLLFNYEVVNELKSIKNNECFHIVTLDPKIYYKLKEKEPRFRLFVFSTDKDFSHFFNLVKYIETNNIKNKTELVYNQKLFNNFE